MISIQASVSKGWLNNKGGFKFEKKYYFDPFFRFEQDKIITAFVKQEFPDYPIYNMEDNLMQAEHISDSQILVGGLQPNLILGALLGGEFIFFDDKDSDISGKPLETLQSLEELPPVSLLLKSPLISSITNQINDIKNKRPDLKIIPPFFWDSSGRATIHGIITTSLKLLGENIFILMMTDPCFVHSLHKWITESYITLINYFSVLAELPVSSIHVGECSCAMLSPKHFDEFVAPYISVLGEEYKKIRLHSCGNTDVLISSFKNIPYLSSIDTGGGTSIKLIREILGNDVSISTFPSPELLMKGAGQENILSWIDELIKDNNNGNLRISYHIEPDYEIANCLSIHKYLKEKYNIQQNRIF